ncbi:N-acetylmuramoyl-L-alanine amidase [Parelusimicrobium proximum]|uniref:N-acetylmuramoyl-L-alanine amidase n=1 Tax=Parelusimicrobium proximum TaxID=3228953 RepID=UPI003D17ED47
MRKFLLFLLSLFVFSQAYALDKTEVFISGKSKGKVASFAQEGTIMVDAHALIKKLGGESRIYSAAKQLRIKKNSYAAEFTVDKREVYSAGAYTNMKTEALGIKGKVFVPVDFFFNKDLATALDRQIHVENGAIYVERNYNIEYSGIINNTAGSQIILKSSPSLKYTIIRKNSRKIEAKIENSIIKRAAEVRVEGKHFINRFSIKQCKTNVCISVVTNKDANKQSMVYEGGNLVLKVYKDNVVPVTPGSEEGKTGDSKPAGTEKPAAYSDGKITVKGKSAIDDLGAETISASAFYGGTGTVVTSASPSIKPAPAPVVKPAIDPNLKNNKKIRIVVDPGHGGKDPGAVRKGSVHEKVINLAVAKEVTALLKKRNIDVKMTRTDDRFIPLYERSKISNDYKADLFVSIHTNASKKTAANGFEVYFRSDKATDAEAAEVAALENEALQYEDTNFDFVDVLLRSLAANEHMNESSKLASYVRNRVQKTSYTGVKVNTNNSVRQANFYVLKGVDSPAVLVEMGYISNPTDRSHLNNKNTRLRIAKGIADGIYDYLKNEGRLK